jgi:hypothetical protein
VSDGPLGVRKAPQGGEIGIGNFYFYYKYSAFITDMINKKGLVAPKPFYLLTPE